MTHPDLWTYSFRAVIALVESGISFFLGNVFLKGIKEPRWRWSTEDSRDMWIGAANTMITAAGIAAALVAALSLGLERVPSPLVVFSAKVAVVSLVICVGVSLALVLTLARGHETAKARNIEQRRLDGLSGETTEGLLSPFAFGLVIVLAFFALSGFYIGFLFLARLIVHFS
jgi:hypothetical protein